MLSANMKRLRSENKLTQADLAKRMGIGRYNIENWERESCSPNPYMIVMLKRALNCSYDELLEEGFDEYYAETK